MKDIWGYGLLLAGFVFWSLAWGLQRLDARKHRLNAAQLTHPDAAERLRESVEKDVEP